MRSALITGRAVLRRAAAGQGLPRSAAASVSPRRSRKAGSSGDGRRQWLLAEDLAARTVRVNC
jgi:hypothetical protein